MARRRRNPKGLDLSSVEGIVLIGGIGLGVYFIYELFQKLPGVSDLPSLGTAAGEAAGNVITGLGAAIQAPFDAWSNSQNQLPPSQ